MFRVAATLGVMVLAYVMAGAAVYALNRGKDWR